MNQLGESGLLGVLEIFFWFMEKYVLIYTSKDSNTGLLVKIDVQIWLWWTGARKACMRMECVLCLQEFLIADPTTKNIVSSRISSDRYFEKGMGKKLRAIW